MRCSTVSPFVSVAPLAAEFAGAAAGVAACASWVAALVALSARAAVSGLTSIVAPKSAAIATERVQGVYNAIAWEKDDMLAPSLDFRSDVLIFPLRRL